VDFGDFAFFRLTVERASLNGGFGKAYALTQEDLVLPEEAWSAIADWEAGAVDHMNEDHPEAISLYARRLLKQPEGNWSLASLDPEGLDLKAGDRLVRLWFDTLLSEPAAIRPVLAELAKKAREEQVAGDPA
jgi:heme iron utilization protein